MTVIKNRGYQNLHACSTAVPRHGTSSWRGQNDSLAQTVLAFARCGTIIALLIVATLKCDPVRLRSETPLACLVWPLTPAHCVCLAAAASTCVTVAEILKKDGVAKHSRVNTTMDFPGRSRPNRPEGLQKPKIEITLQKSADYDQIVAAEKAAAAASPSGAVPSRD